MSLPVAEQFEIIKKHQKEAPVHVVPIAKELGAEVFKCDFESKDGRAFSGMIKKVKKNGKRFEILVNKSHPITRRRFTIAHEIAHLVLHTHLIGEGIADDVLYRSGLTNTIEIQANKLAAEILMPHHLLYEAIQEKGIQDIEKLAEYFWVSKSSMSVRLRIPYES